MTAFSGMLVVEAILQQPWASRNKVAIASVHCATRLRSWPAASRAAKHGRVGFAQILQRHDVDLICGDFSTSLWRVVPLTSAKRQVALLSLHAWRSATTKLIAEERDSSSEGATTTSTLAAPPPAEHSRLRGLAPTPQHPRLRRRRTRRRTWMPRHRPPMCVRTRTTSPSSSQPRRSARTWRCTQTARAARAAATKGASRASARRS